MIRVGLIGAGFIGRNHFNQYETMTERARVVALCDAEADRRVGDWSNVGGNIGDAQGTKRDLGGIRPCSDWREVVAADDIDVIDICVPTGLHPEIAIAAMKAGKHVLCEKPMALTVEQCDEMIAAMQPGKRFMIAQCIRFWPEYAWLKRVTDAGEYGPLRAVMLRRQASTPGYSLHNWLMNPQLSGGAILDLHVHDVDFALYLLGKPASVFAQGHERGKGSVDRVHAAWNYPGGPVVQIEGAWDLHPGFGFNMGFTAVFDNATVVWDIATGKPLTVFGNDGEPVQPTMPAEDGYLGEIRYFIDCIEKGVDPAVSTPRQSRDAVALALAEGQSVAGGELVAINF